MRRDDRWLRGVLVVAALMTCLALGPRAVAGPGGNAGGGSSPDGSARATSFAQSFRLIFNAEATAKRWHRKITRIACQADGEAVFDCALTVRDHGKNFCGVLAIDNQFRIWVNHRVQCSKLWARTPSAPAA